jgi:hypothetical protein
LALNSYYLINYKGQKMINFQKVSSAVSNDATFTELIDVANNVNPATIPACLEQVINETTNETAIRYILKAIQCLAKEPANNYISPRNHEKVKARVSRIKKSTQKPKVVASMLQFEAKSECSSITVAPYSGSKRIIDEKIKAGFLAMPATTTTIFEGFGGGFNIPYIYSTLENINPNIEYIVTENNKTLVNFMKRIKNNLPALKREISIIQAQFNAHMNSELPANANERKVAVKKFYKDRRDELNKLEKAGKYNAKNAALFYYLMNNGFPAGYKMVGGISKIHFGREATATQNIFRKLEKFNTAFNKINLKILNKSYLEVSDKMDKESTFVVYDPPYISDDVTVAMGKKSAMYGLKYFNHQMCLDDFKLYKSGMYFNNLNTEFVNANLDMGLIESWNREGKQKNKAGAKRAIAEIFVRRDIDNGLGEVFNTEGLSRGRLELRRIIAKIKESQKMGVKDKKTTKNPQQGGKIARKSVKNSKKDKKGARITNKTLIPASQNNNQASTVSGNIKAISRVKKYSNKSDIANSGTIDNQTINSKIA